MCIWKQVRDCLINTKEPLSTDEIIERTGLEYRRVIRAIQQIRTRRKYKINYRLITVPVLGDMRTCKYKMEVVR